MYNKPTTTLILSQIRSNLYYNLLLYIMSLLLVCIHYHVIITAFIYSIPCNKYHYCSYVFNTMNLPHGDDWPLWQWILNNHLFHKYSQKEAVVLASGLLSSDSVFWNISANIYTHTHSLFYHHKINKHHYICNIQYLFGHHTADFTIQSSIFLTAGIQTKQSTRSSNFI